MTTGPRRDQHTDYCADPEEHLLIGAADDGTGRREDWCVSEVMEREGAAFQVVDSPNGPMVLQMIDRIRIPLASWLELIRESQAVFARHLPLPRRPAEDTARA